MRLSFHPPSSLPPLPLFFLPEFASVWTVDVSGEDTQEMKHGRAALDHEKGEGGGGGRKKPELFIALLSLALFSRTSSAGGNPKDVTSEKFQIN